MVRTVARFTGPPDRILIGPHWFTLIEDDLRCHKEESIYGLMDAPKCEIVHCSTKIATKSQIKDTVLHETLHAIFDQRGAQFGGDRALFSNADHEELAVRLIADGMLSLLCDNPDLVRWLTDEQ